MMMPTREPVDCNRYAVLLPDVFFLHGSTIPERLRELKESKLNTDIA
ncbi:MAG: hypothetical protein WCL46_03955 [Chlorobium sp.]